MMNCICFTYEPINYLPLELCVIAVRRSSVQSLTAWTPAWRNLTLRWKLSPHQEKRSPRNTRKLSSKMYCVNENSYDSISTVNIKCSIVGRPWTTVLMLFYKYLSEIASVLFCNFHLIIQLSHMEDSTVTLFLHCSFILAAVVCLYFNNPENNNNAVPKKLLTHVFTMPYLMNEVQSGQQRAHFHTNERVWIKNRDLA